MAQKPKFKLNRSGVGELLKSSGAQGDLARRAAAVAAAAGDGHDVKNTTTSRARYTVMTNTDEAARREAENHTLTAAINAAR